MQVISIINYFLILAILVTAENFFYCLQPAYFCFHHCLSSPWLSGDEPLVSKGTSVTLAVKESMAKRKWGVCQVGENNNTLELEIQTPPDCSAGKWRLMIDTQVKGFVPTPAIPSSATLPPGAPANPRPADLTKVLRYKHPHPVYVLFNPWHKGKWQGG